MAVTFVCACVCLPAYSQLPPKCQILLFSATYEERVAAFADKFVPSATKLMLKVTDLALNSIRQYFFRCTDEKDKFRVLSDVYGVLTLGQSVIFVNVRAPAPVCVW